MNYIFNINLLKFTEHFYRQYSVQGWKLLLVVLFLIVSSSQKLDLDQSISLESHVPLLYPMHLDELSSKVFSINYKIVETVIYPMLRKGLF